VFRLQFSGSGSNSGGTPSCFIRNALAQQLACAADNDPGKSVLIVIQAKRLATMEPFLPCALRSVHVVSVHVWRHPLENSESEALGITFSKLRVTAMTGGSVR